MFFIVEKNKKLEMLNERSCILSCERVYLYLEKLRQKTIQNEGGFMQRP